MAYPGGTAMAADSERTTAETAQRDEREALHDPARRPDRASLRAGAPVVAAFVVVIVVIVAIVGAASLWTNTRGGGVVPEASDAAGAPDARLSVRQASTGGVLTRGVRVLSYNIRWGMGADGVRDLDRITDRLRDIDADIALLSEVDVNWRRSGNVDQPLYISAGADYPYHYYGASLRTWASGNTRMSHYGNLLLSRYPIVSARTVPLPTPPGRESRSAVVAHVDVDGAPWIVIGTHLGLNSAERVQQTTRLRELADETVEAAFPSRIPRRDPAIIIMGDFNARPDAPEIARLLNHDAESAIDFVDAYSIAGKGPGHTFPFPDPYARIDYVFTSRSLALNVTNAEALPVPGSDHLPVVVDIARPRPLPR